MEAQSKYRGQWNEIEKAEKKGLPKTALISAEAIYTQSRKAGDTEDYIKSLMYIAKYRQQATEQTLAQQLAFFTTELDASSGAARAVLHSVIGQMYWQYFQQYSWQILSRTELADDRSTDVEQWTAPRFWAEASAHYRASLSRSSQLAEIPLHSIKLVLDEADTESALLCPSVYDFVAMRAILFFSTASRQFTLPERPFEISGARYFALDADFASMQLPALDTASAEYRAVSVMQAYTAHCLSAGKTASLIHTELLRLSYIYEHSQETEKDRWYTESLDRLLAKHSTNPRAAYIIHAMASRQLQLAARYSIQDIGSIQYRNSYTKAVEYAQLAIAQFPKEAPAEWCRQMIADISLPEIAFTAEPEIAAQHRQSVQLAYKNISSSTISIRKISQSTADAILREGRRNDGERAQRLFGASTEVFSEKIVLPETKNFRTATADYLLPALQQGYYAIFINADLAEDKWLPSYQMIRVSDLALLRRTEGRSATYQILDRSSGEPVSGAQIVLEGTKRDCYTAKDCTAQLATLSTDKDGRAHFTVPEQFSTVAVSVSRAGDTLICSNRDYLYSDNSGENTVYSSAVFTDRAIYRPGQIVYFNIIAWKRDKQHYAALSDEEIWVEITDPNYQQVKTFTLTTNTFGSASASFAVPQTGLNGEFHINVRSRYAPADKSIYVEDYKRPLIQISLNDPQNTYSAGDTIAMTGELTSYSGAGLSGAKLSYTVYSQPSLGWGWYSQPEQIIASGETATENEGSFTIRFASSVQNTGRRDPSNLRITITAVDSNGEAQSIEKTITVPADPLGISSDIAHIEDIAAGFNATLTFSNASGIPVPVQGKAYIIRLLEHSSPLRERLWTAPDTALYSREAWYKLYPGNPYANEHNIAHQTAADTVAVFTWENDSSATVTCLPERLRTANYVLLAVANDSKGRTVMYEKRFACWNSQNLAVAPSTTVRYIPLNTTVKAGQSARFAVQAEAGTHIIWELEKDGVLLDKKSFKSGKKTEIITIPVTEAMRGNAAMHFTAYRNGRSYCETHSITVEHADKKLQMQFSSLRSSILPGNTEKWTISIKNSDGKPVPTEIMAGMYDASLDVFAANEWFFSPYHYSSPRFYWHSLPSAISSIESYRLRPQYAPRYPRYPDLNTFGMFSYQMGYARNGRGMLKMSMAEDAEEMVVAADESVYASPNSAPASGQESALPQEKEQTSANPNAKINMKNMSRNNMRETAFFFPQILSQPDGSAELTFTVPDALTRWNVQALAHTQSMDIGIVRASVISQKKLMVQPNWPRYVREGDTIHLFARISNLTDSIMLGGTASISISEALTGEPLALIKAPSIRTFNIGRKGSTAISWELVVPQGTKAINCKIVAAVSNYSDGEERVLPVLSNRILVTQSMPLSMSGAGRKKYHFDALKNNTSKSLTHHSYTVEFCSNPAWYAIQALPYLIEYPHECAEQTFARMYANSLGGYILGSSPLYAQVVGQWRTSDRGESLLSALEKNQELKQLLIEETPWLRNAKTESEQKTRLAQLLDTDMLQYEAGKAADKLAEMQLASGAWPWFRGGQDCRYISQHIICGLGKLRKLTGRDLPGQINIHAALRYADSQIQEDYAQLVHDKSPLDSFNISNMQVHYLYMRSFFQDMPVSAQAEKAYRYYLAQAARYWLRMGIYSQGMTALSLSRAGQTETAQSILASINEFGIDHEELGRYWKLPRGWHWHEAPIETQALLIEAFDEISNSTQSVNAMKLWLIKQKQTQNWPTTKATADAIYALMLRGSDWTADTRQATVSVGSATLPAADAEAGTGYIKQSWQSADVTSALADISIANTADRPAWGAAHWQFFESADKVTADSSGPLSISKQLFTVGETPQGRKLYPVKPGESIQIGSLVSVRIVIETDRDMDFVHLKDMRAAALEPLPCLSGYRWQDGISYYQTIRDAAAHFFIDRLPAGNYVFEYELRAQQTGQFSNGFTSIQCMYAPEFGSRSEGIRISIDK